MFFIDEIPDNKIMRKRILFPLNEKDKRRGSTIQILSPSYESTRTLLSHPLLINRYYRSYYMEKSSMYFISLNEAGYPTLSEEETGYKGNVDSILEKDSYLPISDNAFMIINEDATYDQRIRKLLYQNRIKTDKEIKAFYTTVKDDIPFIKYTYLDYSKYNGLNLIIDYGKYNSDFIANNTFNNIRGSQLYEEFMYRLLHDSRLEPAGYTNANTVIIPVLDWNTDKVDTMWMFNKAINPISTIYRLMTRNPAQLKALFGDKVFLFVGKSAYFKLDIKNYSEKSNVKFLRNIKKISQVDYTFDEMDDEPERDSSPKAITLDIIDKVEKSQNITINDISGISAAAVKTADEKSIKVKTVEPTNKKETEEKKPQSNKAPVSNSSNTESIDKENLKKELVQIVQKNSEINDNTDDTIENMDKEDEERFKKILSDLNSEPDDGPDTSNARTSRMLKLQEDLMDKELEGKSIRDILDKTSEENFNEKLEETSVKVDSVNEEWDKLTYVNSFDQYDMNADIVAIFESFVHMNPSLVIRDIDVKDTSDSENYKETWTVKYESQYGERFTIVVDIPKFIDNRYLKLKGNRKDISGQLWLMPLIKTDMDTVQMVSNYQKIFIERFGTTAGKSNVVCDKLMKILKKNTYDKITVVEGDFSKVCDKYEVPIDYLDMSGVYNKIIAGDVTIFFNQDELRKNYKVESNKGFPYAYNNKTKEVIYYKYSKDLPLFSWALFDTISEESADADKMVTDFNKASVSVKYTYSRASILSTDIPVIVICAYHEGLIKVMKKANVKYQLVDSKPRDFDNTKQDFIKFNDGLIVYDIDYNSSLLMNGLKVCNTENHSISEINSKAMYITFLDSFGGRVKADGLDNFYNMFIDRPITYNTLKYYKLPTDYITLMLQANALLSDNKYIAHTNLVASRRVRRNEQIPGFLYKALSESYAAYCINAKHGRKSTMTIKQSAVIDKVLENNTTEDQTIINALHEYESYNAVTPKGLSGMNSDRSYSLDKREYDESMFNVLSLSTGFAGTVGITRQATIDMNIEGTRGYITNKETDNSKLSPTKSYCMTEALTPFSVTRDDPFRSAMTYVQTSKHSVRPAVNNPALITSGADEALPYMISNTFVHKAKADGEIVEKTDKYMIVKYKDGTSDFVDLENEVQKNSSSGFYVNLKLDSDLKVGSKVKKNQIVAYDKSSFSSDMGATDNIAYNIGTLAKFAVLNTDECFEDSAIVSEDLSKAMSTSIVLEKSKVIPKEANVYNVIAKGTHVEEGDTLMIIQSAFDEEDANTLLKTLSDDEDEISDLGRVKVTSKVTGVIEDIIIYRTVEKSELSPTLKKLVNDYEKDINEKKNKMKEYGIEETYMLPSTETLPPTGKLKKAADGVMIVFYMRYDNKFSRGDKMIYYAALKGVCKDIFPAGKEPYTDLRPKEKIHSLQGISGCNGRMVTSVLITGGINKLLIELSRHCKDILGIPYKDNLF